MLRKTTAVPLLAVLAATSPAQSILLVPSQYPTIQAALNAAPPGGEVRIAPGVYAGTGNVDLVLATGSDLRIRGTGGAGATVLDCQGSAAIPHRGFLISAGGPGLVLEGLTIRNAYEWEGGGIKVEGANPTLRDVRIESCTAGAHGAAMWIGSGNGLPGGATLENCVITGNSAASGSGAILVHGWGQGSVVTLRNCVVQLNQADTGAGLYATGPAGSLVLEACQVLSNQAANWGGGLGVVAGSAASLTTCTLSGNSAFRGGGMLVEQGASATLTGTSLTGNSAVEFGGGIYMNHGGNPVAASLTAGNSTISQNTAGSAGGGALLQDGVHAVFTRTVFDANHTNGDGGGLRAWGGGVGGGSVNANRCVFSFNTAHWSGGGLALSNGMRMDLGNCDIRSNTAQNGTGGGIYAAQANTAPSLTNCHLRGNSSPNNNGGGAAVFDAATATFAGCLIVDNQANDAGGVHGNAAGGAPPTLLFTSCTLVGNTSVGLAHNLRLIDATATLANCIARSTSPLHLQALGTATLAATYSDVQGGSPGTGNFDADPQFLGAAAGDYRIGATSPCVDAGSIPLLPTALTVDPYGTARVVGAGLDVGACEVPPPFPGTNEDLILRTTINGAFGASLTKSAPAGSLLAIHFESPGNTLLGGIPLVCANLFALGAPPMPSPIPGLQIDFVGMIFLLDGTAPFPFGMAALPPGGITLGYPVPWGLSGYVLRVQAGVLSPLHAANGLFATTDAHEIHF